MATDQDVSISLGELDAETDVIVNNRNAEYGVSVNLVISGSLTVSILLSYDNGSSWDTLQTTYTSSSDFTVDIPGGAWMKLKATAYSSGSATGSMVM